MTIRPTRSLAAIATLLLTALLSGHSFAQTRDPRGVKVRTPEVEAVLGTDASIPRYHALVIGINQYRHMQSLRRARPDAEEVAGLLSNRYGFQSVTTLYDKQATRNGISLALRRQTEQLGENDALLVFYAGHGYFDKLLNRGYWIPHEARESIEGAPAITEWFSNNELQDFVSALRARHVLVVSDSCFSGSLFRGAVPDLSTKENAWYRRALQQPSRWGISSGDLELVPDSSAFARQFVNALQYPLKPVFSASDIAGRIKVEVASSTGTQPLFGRLQVDRDSQFGEFVFLDYGGRVGTVPHSPPIPPPKVLPALNPQPQIRPPITGPLEGHHWKSPTTGMDFVWIPQMKMWVGKHEVTNGEYRRKESEHDSRSYENYNLNSDRQPVVYVNFDDARSYAEWLTDREKARLGDFSYRLPSEHEFMMYAQCGDGREFPWGNDWPPRSGKAGNYKDYAGEIAFKWEGISGYNDRNAASALVENSWENPWGLYGVGGNVWEACANDSSGEWFGAWRGGTWYGVLMNTLRCEYRNDVKEGTRADGYGFRLVLSR